MLALKSKQKALLELLNQMSRNLANNNGLDFDIDFGGIKKPDKSPPPCTPTTFREVLLSLVNEQVQVTTPFGVVTGTLLAVKSDYIVMIDDSGDQVLIHIDKIELISEL